MLFFSQKDQTAMTSTITKAKPPEPVSTTGTSRLVCFSFAAYAKTLIDHLHSLNIPILPGLTDSEFTFIESSLHFSFPPDLRSILQEGLPVGHYFPNWRSSSLQQLQLLLDLPFLKLSRNISQNNFWVDSWGQKNDGDGKKAFTRAKEFLDKAPVLVPVYRNCYIPSTPNVAGNPVYFVDDKSVRVLSFDVTRFFQEVEFLQMGFDHHVLGHLLSFTRRDDASTNMPAWAAKTARKIDFWTDVANNGRRVVAREDARGWWRSGGGGRADSWELGECLEKVFWRLRDGGWREEEVRDMMMMDGCDHGSTRKVSGGDKPGKEDVELHVRMLSHVLLRAGWSREDVMYSLDLHEWECEDDSGNENVNGEALVESQHGNSCGGEEDEGGHHPISSTVNQQIS